MVAPCLAAPAKGSKYTYRKTGADIGTIEVNMAPMDAGHTITLKFTSANTAIATEEGGAGCMVIPSATFKLRSNKQNQSAYAFFRGSIMPPLFCLYNF